MLSLSLPPVIDTVSLSTVATDTGGGKGEGVAEEERGDSPIRQFYTRCRYQ